MADRLEPSLHLRRVALAALLTLLPTATPPVRADASPGAAELARAVRQPTLQAGAAVSVRDVRIDTGLAELHLEEGVLFPAAPVAGHVVEMVFLGRGHLLGDAPNPVEAEQLELFTGRRSLRSTFDEAVLVVAGDDASRRLLDGPQAEPLDGQTRRAREIFDDWAGGPLRRLLNVPGNLLLDALGDPPMDAFFAARMRDEELGETLYSVAPDELEPVTLGQFVPIDLTRRQRRRARRLVHARQREGRWLWVELEDLGQWDTWVRSPVRGSDGALVRGVSAFEPRDYRIEVEIADETLRFSASAEVTLEATSPGRRGVILALDPELEVHRIVDGKGRALTFLRNLGELAVALPEPVPAGGTVRLHFDYSGELIDEVGYNMIAISTTTGWYPRVGTVGRATYDVSIDHPSEWQVVAAGRETESIDDGAGRARARFVQEMPVKGFTFEIGNFKVTRHQLGHVSLVLALNPGYPMWEREKIMLAVGASLGYFEGLFGPYPLDHLTLVSAKRGFSQGLLGLLSLSDSVLIDDDSLEAALLQKEDRRLVIAHEMAHQWWGNLVGWQSYRDQWLSESMANYAAGLFASNVLRDVSRGREATAGWRERLAEGATGERTIESLGPIALGNRLDSSHGDGYLSIVYDKGAVVLEMLARVLGEDTFAEMLGHLARGAAGKEISTPDFFAALSRMSGADLDWFALQYVHGTGLPEIDYTFAVDEDPEGGWTVTGKARQRAPYRYQYVVTPSGGPIPDVRRRRVSLLSMERSHLAVPFQVMVRVDDDQHGLLRGDLIVSGRESTFRLRSQREPVDFWLDRDEELLATFHCESRRPKRSALLQGMDHAASGDDDRAEEAFRRALASPLLTVSRRESMPAVAVIEQESRALDEAIHLEMARLRLDQGRLEAAARHLDEARRQFLDKERGGSLPDCSADRVVRGQPCPPGRGFAGPDRSRV